MNKLTNILLLVLFLTPLVAYGQTTWNGSVSSSWNDPANWSNGVPDSTVDVTIPNVATPASIPVSNAHVRDLSVSNGGTLNWVSCGGILYIHGGSGLTNGGTIDLGSCTPANQLIFLSTVQINNGGTFSGGNGVIDLKGSSWTDNPGATFDPGTSTVHVDGTGNQSFNGQPMTFYKLVFDNPSGTITINNDITVLDSCIVSSGSTVDVPGSLTVEGTLINNGNLSSTRPLILTTTASIVTQVDITFNKPVDPTTSQTASNYSIANAITVTSATRDAANHAIVHLTVSTMTDGIQDTLTVNNVNDTIGNTIQPNTIKFFIPRFPAKYYSRTTGGWNTASTWSRTGFTGPAASNIPGAFVTDTVVIGNGHTVTMNVNVTNLNEVNVDSTGTLNTGAFNISGTGTFTLASGGTLGIGSASGITTSGAAGNIQTSIRNFNAGGNYSYDGSTAQATGNGLPSTVNNLTVSNSGNATVTLNNSLTVNSSFALTQGTFSVGSNTLTLNGPVSGGGTLTSADSGTVIYNQSSHGQSVLAGVYGNLTFSNFNKTLDPSGVISIASIFTPGTATNHAITGSTIDYNGSGSQSLNSAFTYNNLKISNTGSGVTLSSGTVQVNGNLTNAGKLINNGTITLGP